MKIRHERPMSDLSFKVRAPLGLTLPNGDVVTVENWSLAGIDLPNQPEILPTVGELSIPFQGVDIRFPVRFAPDEDTGFLSFKGLTGRQRETLAVFYRSILSGKMASTEDVIVSLDTPVDLVPMEETEEECREATAGKTPRSLRAVWTVLLYLMIAAVVFQVLGTQIWGRLTTITVTNARVAAQSVAHVAGEAGYVDKVLVAPGDPVRKGQRLVVVSDPDAKSEINALRQDIRTMKRRLTGAQTALAAVEAGLPEARQTLTDALRLALARKPRRDFFGHYDMEEIERLLREIATFDAGISLRPGDFMANLDALRQAEFDLRVDYARLKRDLSAAKTSGGAADIIAATDGTVTEVDVFTNQFIPRGTRAVVVDDSTPRVVTGWLDQAYASVIHTGMRARITLNAGGTARAVTGEIAEVTAMVDPERPGYFGLFVTVTPDPEAATDRTGLFRADAPAALVLLRPMRWLQPIRSVFDARS